MRYHFVAVVFDLKLYSSPLSIQGLMFEDDLEGISDDDIDDIETDDGDSKGEKTESEEKIAFSKQPTKVDALDIAWETLKGENKEKSKEKSVDIPINVETEGEFKTKVRPMRIKPKCSCLNHFLEQMARTTLVCNNAVCKHP